MVINSDTNKNYRLCLKLGMKKFRDKYGLYIIEGDNLIFEAIKSGVIIKSIFVREDYGRFTDLNGREPYVLNRKLFDRAARTETSQGILAIVERKNYIEDDFFADCSGKNIVVIDRLQDPGNIGTVIRTAEAAGYMGALIMKGTGDVYSPKAVRAAAGSIFRFPVLFIDTPLEALTMLRSHGKKTAGACPEAAALYSDVDLSGDVALIIGNEGGGLCGEFRENADMKVKIPMKAAVDSLNAAVAAGILMYGSIENNRKV